MAGRLNEQIQIDSKVYSQMKPKLNLNFLRGMEPHYTYLSIIDFTVQMSASSLKHNQLC